MTGCLSLAQVAQGDIVFNNFGAGDTFGASGRILEGEDVNQVGDVDQAASFLVGAQAYLLTEISLGINVRSSPAIGTGPLDVVIAADVGGAPGGELQHVLLDINVTGEQVASASFPGTLLLEPNTTYWVIADAMDTFDGAWNFNSIGDLGITAGRTDLNPWNVRVLDDHYAFRVEGRPVDIVVPESGAGLLFGLTIFGLGGYTWHRRRVNAASANAA